MPPFTLQTLGALSLRGPTGDIPLDEPRLAALIVLLAIAGDAGVSGDELLLLLTPEETKERGRTEIARLVGVARLRLGGEQAIVSTQTGYALEPGRVALDVRVLAQPQPAECAEFLEGFKLAGSPEFREWLTGARHRVEPLETPAADAGSAKRSLSWRSTVAAVAAVLILATAGYFAWPRAASGFATGDPLLLADVENETGDSLFDVGLASAASVALQQSGRLRLYPRSNLARVYRLMRITNLDTALTFDLAKDVAQRDGVRFVLGLTLARIGDGYRVTGRLTDVSNPDRVATVSANAKSKTDVLTALDEVLIAMRARLGESRRDIEERRVPLPWVTTSSLEALRAYGDGSVAWNRGNYPLATELWQRAVDLDTGFAMAYGSLGQARYFVHDRTLGEQYFGEAFKRESRLTERERLRLRESAADFRGHPDSALMYSGMSAVRFPSVTSWYNYGTSLMNAGRDSEAIPALEKALGFDAKHVNSYVNLATVSKSMRRYDDALRYYTHAEQLDTTVVYRGNIGLEWGGAFVKLGRYAEAESLFTRMSKAQRIDSRALGFRSLGYLALWRGQVDESIAFFHQALDATVQMKSPLGELRNRLLLVAAYRAAGREPDGMDELTRTMAILTAPVAEPQALALVASAAVKLGRTDDAAKVMDAVNKRVRPDNTVDVAAAVYVQSLMALAKHHPDSALQLLRTQSEVPTNILRLAARTEAFRATGQLDSARLVLSELRLQAGFGAEGEDDWLHAPLVLGDVLLAQHDTANAVKEYQRFLDQWRAAPAGLPDMVVARTRLAALRVMAPR